MKELLYFAKQIHSYSGKILYVNMIAMLLISVFEGIGIFLLVPLLGLIGVVELGENTRLSWASNLFDGIPEIISLLIILSVFIVLIIGQGYFQRQQLILNVRIQQSFTRYLREETYKNLIQANWFFYLNKRKSDLINLMTTEVFRVSGGISLFFQFISSLIFTMIQIGLAFWLSYQMTSLILLFGLVLIVFSRTFLKRSQTLGEETLQISQNYLGTITDHFNGIKDIKSNTMEQSQLTSFLNLSEKMEKNYVNFTKLNTLSSLVYKLVSAFLIAFLVFFSFSYFESQPAQMLMILVIFSRLWPRITGIQSNMEYLVSVIPSFKALIKLKNQSSEAKEINTSNYQSIKPLKIEKGLEFSHVSYRYNSKEDSYALKDINLFIPSNQMTAVVGRSGAGKSTLIDMILGLNRPEKGEILIDHVALTSDNLLTLRKSISYISQDPFLFNATIRENLLLMKPDATDEQIWEALHFSAAADFVEQLPKGMDTEIGDRGIRLSGGERQRIVLARAILRKPAILILDEATSALDTENETKIQKALESLKGHMTIVVIAHRLSTISNADQVLVLDQGEIIQHGRFNELAQSRGLFNQLLGGQLEVIS
ncbi:ABC transporter ATP-binding protein [Peribacillus sp. NPDC097284]|uniref:ABC transporter ATP-binding protein n=1 Tax=Peribacillus sp. NPDC097284 TaxID=3364401 RepID=UPI00382D57B0